MNRGLKIGNGPSLGGLGAFGVGGGGGGTTSPVITYILRDEFTTTEAAPMVSPRTAEPGPGTATVVDTTNLLSIASGKLTFATGGAGWANPAYFGSVVTRAAGMAIILGAINESTLGNAIIGFATSAAAGFNPSSVINFSDNGQIGSYDLIDNDTGKIRDSSDRQTNTNYKWAIVLRSTGAFVLCQGVFSSETLSDWTVLMVHNVANTANVYPVVGGSSSNPVATLDKVSVIQLAAPWTTDYGICTSYAASASANATQAHEANAWVDATWTAVTAATYELSVRQSDADNRWIIRCDQGGSTIKLIERNAGVETERASAAQTWTNGVAYRILVRVSGNRIKNWVNEVIKNDYSAASFNNTATVAKTSLAVANFACYPYALSGAALTAITSVE